MGMLDAGFFLTIGSSFLTCASCSIAGFLLIADSLSKMVMFFTGCPFFTTASLTMVFLLIAEYVFTTDYFFTVSSLLTTSSSYSPLPFHKWLSFHRSLLLFLSLPTTPNPNSLLPSYSPTVSTEDLLLCNHISRSATTYHALTTNPLANKPQYAIRLYVNQQMRGQCS